MSSHRSEDEDSEDMRFKTITSEDRTRNPTTDKKKQPKSVKFMRSHQLDLSPKREKEHVLNRSQSLVESLYGNFWGRSALESRKWRYLEAGRYQKATKVDEKIQRAKSLLNHSEMRKLKRGQVQQKKSIRDAYQLEI